jgi:hypothetical protein
MDSNRAQFQNDSVARVREDVDDDVGFAGNSGSRGLVHALVLLARGHGTAADPLCEAEGPRAQAMLPIAPYPTTSIGRPRIEPGTSGAGTVASGGWRVPRRAPAKE